MMSKAIQNRYKEEGSGDGGIIVVHVVNEVYIHIPAELSAAAFELKIAGSLRIADKQNHFYLMWSPIDLTEQDVACLYSSQGDEWMFVDDLVEFPVVIDPLELEYADKDYRGGSLELPDPIVPYSSAEEGQDKVELETQAGAVNLGNRVVAFSNTKTVAKGGSSKPSVDTVNFPLCQLHSIRETTSRERSLTFFLTTGQELPTLYFHDGGSTGLLQVLQRYIYLEKDPRVPFFFYAKDFDKSQRWKLPPKPVEATPDQKPSEFKTIIPPGMRGAHAVDMHAVIQGAVSGVLGITRVMRQHLLPEKQLLDMRPGTEDDDDREETIQTCVLSDVMHSHPHTSPYSPSHVSSPPPPSNTPEPSVRHFSTGMSQGKGFDTDPETSLISDFQIITDIRGKLSPCPSLLPRQPPVSFDEWERLRDDSGRITADKQQQLRARVFAGGIEHKLRKEAWKYLLDLHQFEVTDLERMERHSAKEREYWAMKGQWQTFTSEQEKRFRKWREAKHLINKDVLRTDRDLSPYNSLTSPKLKQMEDILRTYTMYNFDLGYVQGMSDLLAPLLVVMDNEVDAFWCFVGFMETVQHHFEMSQEGMRIRLKQLRALLNITDPDLYKFLKEKESNNLYCCFRWLLVHFKREFNYEGIMQIWEVIWTNFLSPDFSLFIALALLHREKASLLNQSFDFSDILQHLNGLSKQIPVHPVLQLAEALCYQLGSSAHLPDDLQTLVVKPLPLRSSIPQMEQDTIICNPNSRAVPST